MRSDDATTTPWRKKMVEGALGLLILAGIGLPNAWAQLEYDGGYVQTHREDGGSVLMLDVPQHKARSASANAPPSLFPDNDFYYPIHEQAPTSIARSYYYYYAGGQAGSSVSSATGQMPLGISAAVFPWNQAGFKDYRDLPETARNTAPFSPRKYSLEAIPVSQQSPVSLAAVAALVVHLPEHALFWVEGVPTRSTGRTRYFESPPLRPGRKYSYSVRAAWIEDGRWVSQSRNVPVRAGMIQAIYLHAKSDPGKSETRRGRYHSSLAN